MARVAVASPQRAHHRRPWDLVGVTHEDKVIGRAAGTREAVEEPVSLLVLADPVPVGAVGRHPDVLDLVREASEAVRVELEV